MKKFIAVLLIFLFSMTSVAAIAEADFSSYTDADLRGLRTQIDSAIAQRSRDEGKGEAVCNAFIQCMQELGHSLELTSEIDGEFFFLHDPQLEPGDFTFAVNGGYSFLPPDDFTVNNQDYIRDCMVAMAMAVARVEGVEIFSDEIGTAMRDCMGHLPEDFFADNISICWDNDYGYQWLISSKDGTTVLSVF